MNILFFLTPKEEVAYVYSDHSIRNVLEKMQYHRYTAIPIIDREGRYAGTVTEGDLLWALRKIDPGEIEKLTVMDIERRLDNKAVHTGMEMQDLVENATNQNFVPVVDDRDFFIGIITRKQIIIFLYEQYLANRKEL